MSGSFDTSVIRTEEIRSIYQTYEQRSVSQRRFVVQQPGHTYELSVTTKPMQRSEWQKLQAFLDSQKGRYSSFTYVPVSKSSPLGTLAGSTHSVTVEGAHSASATSVALVGLPASSIVLLAGDFLKFANHSKVYSLESTSITSSSSGYALATIQPALVSALSNGEAVTYQNVPMTVALTADDWKLPVEVSGLAEISLTMREAI